MARPPEIGNVQLHPDRPLRSSDKNGYVLKFYCPIQGKRIRKNSGTRDRREARRILRECRERLLNGEYVASGGAITAQQTNTKYQIQQVLPAGSNNASEMSWQDCFDRYRNHYQVRSRAKSMIDAMSRLSISERILAAERLAQGLPQEGPIREYLTLDALERLQERLLEGAESNYESRSPMTVNTTIGAVMAFARYCFRHGWIESIPPLTKLSVDEVMKGRPISEKEFNQMIEATPDVVGERATASWQFLLRVLWESGFRIGDCLDFSWDDERHIHPLWPNQLRQHPTLIVPSTQKNGKSQEIPMLPGLQALLGTIPFEDRTSWVVRPIQPDKDGSTFKPTASDLRHLAENYSNSAIARACNVSETAVRKWLCEAGLMAGTRRGNSEQELLDDQVELLRHKSMQEPVWIRNGEEHRPTKEWVGRIISDIGEAAGIVVQQADMEKRKRIKYASAHDIRRGCAQRLINAGISAETLKLVMRHKDFATTERYYGAMRAAQSAAAEIFEKLKEAGKSTDIDGEVFRVPQLSQQEVKKLRTLLNSL